MTLLERCAACDTPTIEGFAWCGRCGAPVAAPEVEAVDVADEADGDQSSWPLADELPGVLNEVDAEHQPEPPRLQRVAAVLAVVLLATGMVRLTASTTRASADHFAAAPSTNGSATVDVELAQMAGDVAWSSQTGAGPEWLSPVPWAAPTVMQDRVVAVVPGALFFVDRDPADGSVRRVELPISAATSAAPAAYPVVGEVAVIGDGALWFASENGVHGRTPVGHPRLAEVTPYPLGAGLLVQTELGGLELLRRATNTVHVVATVRGLDAAEDPGEVPSFNLAVRALGIDGAWMWVGARSRQDNTWSLWRLDPDDLSTLGVVRLQTQDVPTIAGSEHGLVVAHDDVVRLVAEDGSELWSRTVGEGAEVMGVSGPHVAVRHDLGRVTFATQDGRLVSSSDDRSAVEGPHSTAVADEILINQAAGLVVLNVTGANASGLVPGAPMSIAGHDEAVIAHVNRSTTGLTLQLTPTPQRIPFADRDVDIRQVPLAVPNACRVTGVGDRVVWHDGARLRSLDLDDGTTVAAVDAGSSRGSTLAVDRDVLHVVDERGFVRRFDQDLEERGVLPIGDDAVGGVAFSEGLILGAGGTGAAASLSAFDGFLRGIAADGSSPFITRIESAVAGPPVALGDRSAIRDRDGSIVLFGGPQQVRRVEADPRSLDSPVVDERGVLFRDGVHLVALHSHGEQAWRIPDLARLPGVTVSDGVVVVRTMDEVRGLDRATGSALWTYSTNEVAGASALSILATPDSVIVVLPNGVDVLALDTGRVRTSVEGLPGLAGGVAVTSEGLALCTTADQVVLVS